MKNNDKINNLLKNIKDFENKYISLLSSPNGNSQKIKNEIRKIKKEIARSKTSINEMIYSEDENEKNI